MKTKKILIFVLMVLQSMTIEGKSKFYNSKSLTVGLTTNNQIFDDAGFGGKTFTNYLGGVTLPFIMKGNRFDRHAMEHKLNEMQIGKKVLALLFERDKGKLSEDLLRQRAWENVQLMDVERSVYGTYSPELILKEDILPILESNYILIVNTLSHKGFKGLGAGENRFNALYSWIVFHVDIDQKIWNEVIAAWEDLDKFDRINVNVSYVASGVVRERRTLYDYHNHMHAPLIRDISKKVPALAIRGQVLSSSPYKAAIGTREGVKPRWDVLRIYRQHVNSKGDYKSKLIGHAYVSNATDSVSDLVVAAGKTGSGKKGDMAIMYPGKRYGRSLYYQWQGISKALRYDFDMTATMHKPFLFHVHEIDLRIGVLNDHRTMLYAIDNEKYNGLYRSPWFASIGCGMGIGALLFRGCELEAYGLLQGEVWGSARENKFVHDEEKKSSIYGLNIRFPIGLKFQMNLKYPIRLVAGVEYPITLVNGNKDISRSIFDACGYKRNNINFFVGLRYAY